MDKIECSVSNTSEIVDNLTGKNTAGNFDRSELSIIADDERKLLSTENNEEKSQDSDSSLKQDNPPEQDEWLDIMGSGDFKKLILKKGCDNESRPDKGDKVSVAIQYFVGDKLIEQQEHFEFIVGDMDVIQGIDLVICLMEKDEVAKVKIPAKLAYGKKGRSPDIPPETALECEIHLKDVQPLDQFSLSVSERLKLGDEKRLRGNFFYERAEYLDAVFCYERSAEYLEGVRDSSGSTTEESQKVVDMVVKVYNNMAASHLKLNAFPAALKSVESVLNIQPNNVKALFRKAKILGGQGSTDEAINCLKIALSIEPDTKVILSELTKLKIQKKKEEQSQRELYRKMFSQSEPPKEQQLKQQESSFCKVLKGTAIAAGMTGIIAGLVAFFVR